MLNGNRLLFLENKSLSYVCYRASEAADTKLQRLLSELPKAGVALIELDAWEQSHGICTSWEAVSPQPEQTLLLAGSLRTLLVAAHTPFAVIGYGCLTAETALPVHTELLVEGFDEVDVELLDRVMKRAQGLPWIVAETERTYLREMTPEDLDALYALYAPKGMSDYTQPPAEREQESAYIRDYIENMYRFYGYGMWLICERTSGRVIGRAGFAHREQAQETVLELGYLVAADEQRKGYAAEVCSWLLRYAREELADFGKLYCFVHEQNAASHALMRRLAFVPECCIRVEGSDCVRYAYPLTVEEKNDKL